jgi:hypothetical protein
MPDIKKTYYPPTLIRLSLRLDTLGLTGIGTDHLRMGDS